MCKETAKNYINKGFDYDDINFNSGYLSDLHVSEFIHVLCCTHAQNE